MDHRVAACVWLFTTAASAEVTVPHGWRRPAAALTESCVRPGDDPYRLVADFDGDGRADEARLLIKRRGQVLGLWVWLAGGGPQLLFQWPEVQDGQHSMGMSVVAPGTSSTVCGRHGNCAPGDSKQVAWSHPAIDLYSCESSNQLIWWDTKKKRFRSVFVTD